MQNNINNAKTNKYEEWLNYIPTIESSIPGDVDEIAIGIDSGSTFTRFCQYQYEDLEMGTVHRFNSDVLDVENIDHVRSSSKSLYSNLEFIVNDITASRLKPVKIFESAHFVKGDLLTGKSASVIERSSRVSKTMVTSTYYNIISAITLEILDNIRKGQAPKSCYRVNLAMTFPPREFKSKKVLDDFKNKIAGQYTVEMPRIKFSTSITISKDIYFENEPTAIVYSIANDEPEDIEHSIIEKTAIIIDGGGGTTDKAIVINGQLADEQADTGEFGGKILLEDIARICQSEIGGSKPSLSIVEKSLDNGVLTRGNTKIDIFEYIDMAKHHTAQRIFTDLNNLCDNMQMSIVDIEEIILHGRLFSQTITEDNRKTSVADILNKKLKEIAPDIKVSILTGDDYVCKGAVVSLWAN